MGMSSILLFWTGCVLAAECVVVTRRAHEDPDGIMREDTGLSTDDASNPDLVAKTEYITNDTNPNDLELGGTPGFKIADLHLAAAMSRLSRAVYHPMTRKNETGDHWELTNVSWERHTRASGVLITAGSDHYTIYRATDGTKRCALAFSGSDDVGDWSHDLKDKKVDMCGYLVHGGFAEELEAFLNSSKYREEFAVYLADDANCGDGVYLTGHSAGGSVATLLAACENGGHLGAYGPTWKFRGVYTFGAAPVSMRPISNATAGDGCILGARFWNQDPKQTDPIAGSLKPMFHPQMAAVKIIKARKESRPGAWGYACSSRSAAELPSGTGLFAYVGDLGLHMTNEYVSRTDVLLKQVWKKHFIGRDATD